MKSQNQTKQVIEEDIRIEKNEQGIETYLFDPYNPLNNAISQNDVQNILSKYGIQSSIHNFELYKGTFIHRSYLSVF